MIKSFRSFIFQCQLHQFLILFRVFSSHLPLDQVFTDFSCITSHYWRNTINYKSISNNLHRYLPNGMVVTGLEIIRKRARKSVFGLRRSVQFVFLFFRILHNCVGQTTFRLLFLKLQIGFRNTRIHRSKLWKPSNLYLGILSKYFSVLIFTYFATVSMCNPDWILIGIESFRLRIPVFRNPTDPSVFGLLGRIC